MLGEKSIFVPESKKTMICPRCGRSDLEKTTNCPLDGHELDRKIEMNPLQIRELEEKYQISRMLNLTNKEFSRFFNKTRPLIDIACAMSSSPYLERPIKLSLKKFLVVDSTDWCNFDFSLVLEMEDKIFSLQCKCFRRLNDVCVEIKNLPELIKTDALRKRLIEQIIDLFIFKFWFKKD